jgi:hypothetical protein
VTHELILAPPPPESREGEPYALSPAQAILRKLDLSRHRRSTSDSRPFASSWTKPGAPA